MREDQIKLEFDIEYLLKPLLCRTGDDVGNGDDNKLTLCAIKEALMTMMIL